MTTRIVEDRQKGLEIGFKATDWTRPVSFDDYARSLKDWIIRTIERNGEPIGAVYTKGDELHVSIKPTWRKKWITKGLMKELFSCRVTTRVTPGHEYMFDVLKRLGFKDDGTGLMVKEH